MHMISWKLLCRALSLAHSVLVQDPGGDPVKGSSRAGATGHTVSSLALPLRRRPGREGKGFHFRRMGCLHSQAAWVLWHCSEAPTMTWFQKQLVSNSKSYGGVGLQMPLGIPIAAGVLALLALLALACHCLREACKSKWRPRCRGWGHRGPRKRLQLVSVRSLDETQLGTPSVEPTTPQLPSPPSP